MAYCDGVSDDILHAAEACADEVRVVECDPNLADTTEFCEHYGYELGQSANAIVVVGKSEPRTYACCIVLATSRLNVNTTVRRALGTRKASFASSEETRTLTGMEIGGVTPFGLPPELPIWIDAAVVEVPDVIVGGGSRDRKFFVPSLALTRLPNASVVDDLATPIGPVASRPSSADPDRRTDAAGT